MKTICAFLVTTLCSLTLSASAFAEPSIADADLRERFDELSASTLIGGAGPGAYEKNLHAEYSRWAMGEVYEGREKFVRSLEEWWDYGMRVSSRNVELVGVDISDGIAIIRFKTTETFEGPEGPVEGFSGYVSNIWIKENGEWRLLAAEISSAAE